MKAFQKENQRKIVLFNSLMNYIANGLIAAPRQSLKEVIDICIKSLLEMDDLVEFHYQCYLNIAVNLISMDYIEI